MLVRKNSVARIAVIRVKNEPDPWAQKTVAEAPLPPAPVSVTAMTPDALRDQGLALAQILQLRVMERLDGVLEERLRYALADVVQLQTQALYQSIRQEVEGLVSAAVNEAVAQELADLRAPTATRG